MNLLLKIVFLCFFFLSLNANETIRITNGEWPPFLSKDLKHFGVTSHVVTESFKLQNIKVEFKWYPWKRAYHVVKNGNTTASIAWAKTEERKDDFLFSEPILNGEVVFFHRRDKEFTWSDLNSLNNKKIGTISGYVYANKLEKLRTNPTILLKEVSNEIKLFELLLFGRFDVVVINKDVGFGILNKYYKNRIQEVTYHKKIFHQELLRILFSKKDKKSEYFLKHFNKGLLKLKESGVFDKLYNDLRDGKYIIK